MSANLVADVTVTGNILVQGSLSNVQYMNTSSIPNLPIQFTVGVPAGQGKIAAGRYVTAVILTDGTVRTVGLNSNGQLGVNDTTSRLTPVQVWGISSSAAAVSGGLGHTVVLLADGTVRTFGSNSTGQLGVNDTTSRLTPVQVWGISSSATKIACGHNYTAVILANGTVQVFGRNDYGALGVNDTTNRSTPVQVWGISSSATAVACGQWHTAVLLANGTVQTFGLNTDGRLGVNDTTSRQTPVQVWGISSSATVIACGWYNTSVLLANGTVQAFGRNAVGQLGVNDTSSRLTPVQVWGISSSAVDISFGEFHQAILLSDGTLRTFGQNSFGQLGVNDTTSRLTPVQVIAAGAVTALGKVAGGLDHTIVLLADGTVRTFGANGNGQLGLGDTTSRLTPVQITGLTSATGVDCGYFRNAAIILSDGTVRTFGYNNFGQLGVNDTTQRLTPVQVWGISSSAVAVACGFYHMSVLMADGTVRTFGRNLFGQLGVNDNTDRSTPVQVWGISSSAVAIACGYNHIAVILADGTVRTFGFNNLGQLGVNDNTSRLTPVQVWGISSSAVAVAGGSTHTAVLLADGTVRAFGRNTEGQLGVNDTTNRLTPVQVWGISSSATAVACGQYFTAILLANGTVRTFGDNPNGQLGVNDTTQRLTPVQVFGISSSAAAIACGRYHAALILADGTVRTFGKNDSGQLGVNDTTQRTTPVTVLNITTALTPSPAALLTSAAQPFFSFNGPIITSNVGLGVAPSLFFQLDMSTDGARKLTTTTWTTGSDERIKSDIQTANIARCAEIVDSLDLKYFKWREDFQGRDKHALGWLAQDVKEFFPNAVTLTSDHGLVNFHTLDSDQLIKVLYGAIKHTLNSFPGTQ